MEDRKDFELIMKVIDRSEAMKIGTGTRITRLLDMENAHKQFNLRLNDMLIADDMEFAHDFVGIQSHIDRLTGKVGGFFLPRFAGDMNVMKGD